MKSHSVSVDSFPIISEINKLDLFENGLVKNINYYKKYKTINYLVGIYPGAEPFQELYIEDFETLSFSVNDPQKMWLPNFLVDICLYVLHSTKQEIDNYSKSYNSTNICECVFE